MAHHDLGLYISKVLDLAGVGSATNGAYPSDFGQNMNIKMSLIAEYWSLPPGSPDASMSSVLWAKTQQLPEDALRQLPNIYGQSWGAFCGHNDVYG